VDVGVTPEAAEYISLRGGRLYLWEDAVGRAWAVDRSAFVDPGRGITFRTVGAGGVALMLAADLEEPKTLQIRVDRLPHRLHVEWDGARWGWRGGAEGAPSSF
jgi:hypothetical protein